MLKDLNSKKIRKMNWLKTEIGEQADMSPYDGLNNRQAIDTEPQDRAL
jgi:hypothetical protein